MPERLSSATVASGQVGFELTGPGTSPPQMVRAVWASRQLISVLARKDFLVRYRRTSLGLLWAVILPAVQAIVLGIVFSHFVGGAGARGVAGGRSVGYAVFVFAGMVPWSFFNAAVAAGGTAVVDGTGLARRIYFPRLVLPLVAVGTATFPLLVTTGILLLLQLTLGPDIGWRTLWVLPGMALAVGAATAVSVLVSAAHVYVRDLRYGVGAGLLMLFYLTPVIYPLDRVPDSLGRALALLPGAGPVELFRLSVGAADDRWVTCVLSTLTWTVVVGVLGFALHCARDRVLADRL